MDNGGIFHSWLTSQLQHKEVFFSLHWPSQAAEGLQKTLQALANEHKPSLLLRICHSEHVSKPSSWKRHSALFLNKSCRQQQVYYLKYVWKIHPQLKSKNVFSFRLLVFKYWETVTILCHEIEAASRLQGLVCLSHHSEMWISIFICATLSEMCFIDFKLLLLSGPNQHRWANTGKHWCAAASSFNTASSCQDVVKNALPAVCSSAG